MKTAEFELILPAQSILPEEEIFTLLESVSEKFSFTATQKKRFIRVAMELLQNLTKHRSKKFLSIFKLRLSTKGEIKLITFNIALEPTSEILEHKFQKLKEADDFRKLFKEKLIEKITHKESVPGDFGLDLCFRNSTFQELKIFPREAGQHVIYLAFHL